MNRYRFGTWTFDAARRELANDGEAVPLSPRAFEALHLLLRSYPAAVSRDALYAHLWPDTIVNLTNLNNVIAEIRSAVHDEEKKLVVTKHRFGYAVAVPVADDQTEGGGAAPFTMSIAGQTIALRHGDNLIGRSPDAGIALDLPSISRHHAVIHVSGSHATVEDLRSKNGTFVGNRRVETSHELRDRDTVRFGTVCGVFRAVPRGGTTISDPAPDPTSR